MKEIRDERIKLKDGNREGRRERGRGRGEHGERRPVNRLEGENQVMRSKDKSGRGAEGRRQQEKGNRWR